MFSPFQARTDAKLEYARIHLKEITSRQKVGSGDAFERAHEESFLFHLIGAKDSFLQEINVAYQLGLDMWDVKEKSLESKLIKRRRKSNELEEIIKLEELREKRENRKSWLAISIELRNQGMHRFNIPRLFHAHTFKEKGNEYKDKVFLNNPLTGQPIPTDIPVLLQEYLTNMENMLQELRPTLPQESAGDV